MATKIPASKTLVFNPAIMAEQHVVPMPVTALDMLGPDLAAGKVEKF